jgi:hypothetical protein
LALNLSDAAVEVAGARGRVAISTDRARDGEAVAGALALGPWEGAVLARRVVSRAAERRIRADPL